MSRIVDSRFRGKAGGYSHAQRQSVVAFKRNVSNT